MTQRSEVQAVTRACARPGCADAATATFVYDYQARTTWLDALAAERHPMAYDLCPAHADGLTVPRGWRLVDRRGPTSLQGALAS
ncbi:MAG TPA: DUF3499 family protein [Actinomycetota bacterium]|jgi:hypothetical protein|nr:DUF3499 family protein [Actinomycetota bacterium]